MEDTRAVTKTGGEGVLSHLTIFIRPENELFHFMPNNSLYDEVYNTKIITEA
jgi:hypothetical protein